MMFYYDTNCYDINQVPFSYLGDQKDLARILTQLTLLIVGADACTTHTLFISCGERTTMHNLPSVAHEETSL